jgi:F-type H+-transporting ATPase subunit b
MLIDWFTVLAQVINFLILVYLLKRFLYKPILKAIDAREKRVASQLQEAAEQKTAADEQHKKFDSLNQELHKNKENLIAAAQKEAEAEQQRLMDNARKEYDVLRRRLHDALEKERSDIAVNLKKSVQEETFEIARKTLADLAGVSLEAQIIDVFIQKIKTISQEEKVQLIDALQSAIEPVRVQSSFEMNAAQKAACTEAIKDLLGENTKMKFETTNDILSGVELSANGFKIAWNINEYLGSLEKRIKDFTGNIESQQSNPENMSHEN